MFDVRDDLTCGAPPNPSAELELIQLAADGDPSARATLFTEARRAVKQIVRGRMDRQLRARVDDSDVIQDTLLEASQRLDDYLAAPKVCFFVWLRFLAVQRLAGLWRHHMTTQARNLRREADLQSVQNYPVDCVATREVARLSPCETLTQLETEERMRLALDALDDASRVILELRYFHRLSNSEASVALGISPSAACNRHFRALERLKHVLLNVEQEIWP